MATIPSKPSDIVTTTPADTDSSKNTASAIRSKASATQALITWLQAVIGSVSTGENDLVTRIATALSGLFKLKVTSADTTGDYLQSKLVAGSNITITKNNAGANETLTIAASVSASGSTATLTEAVSSGDKLETFFDYSTDTIKARAMRELKYVLGDAVIASISSNVRILSSGQYVYMFWVNSTTLYAIIGMFDTNFEKVTWGTVQSTSTGVALTSNVSPAFRNSTDIRVIFGTASETKQIRMYNISGLNFELGTQTTWGASSPANCTNIEAVNINGYINTVAIASGTAYFAKDSSGSGGTFATTISVTNVTELLKIQPIASASSNEAIITYLKSDGIYTKVINITASTSGSEVAIKSLGMATGSMTQISATEYIYAYVANATPYRAYARAVTLSSTFPYTLTWGTEIDIGFGQQVANGGTNYKGLEIITPSTKFAIVISNAISTPMQAPYLLSGVVIDISGTTLTKIKTYLLSDRMTYSSSSFRWLANNVLKIENNVYAMTCLGGGLPLGVLKPLDFNLALAGGSEGANISISPTIRR